MATYDTIGERYATFRRSDPRIMAVITAALGNARRVVNVGAGSGSYEPADRDVLAIEPSETMIQQRGADAAPCVRGSAGALPIVSRSVDAAMAVLSAHHWPDLKQGLAEMARVARSRVVLVTWVPDASPFWLVRDYFPEIFAHDQSVFPGTRELVAVLERVIGPTTIEPLLVPHDCTDGFLGAYWRRPSLYLDADRRAAQSSFARIDAEPGLAMLHRDLNDGTWAERNRPVLELQSLDVGYRLAVSEVALSTG